MTTTEHPQTLRLTLDKHTDLLAATAQVRSADPSAPIHLDINSTGGHVYDGLALYGELTEHPGPVTARVVFAGGVALCAALAAGRVEVAATPGAGVAAVHESWTLETATGTATAAAVEHLDRVDNLIAGIYARHAGGTVDEWRDRMRAETFFDVDEVTAVGLFPAGEVAP